MLIDTHTTAEAHDTLKIAYDKGESASGQAHARLENPYHKGTALHEWWDAGWSSNLDELTGV